MFVAHNSVSFRRCVFLFAASAEAAAIVLSTNIAETTLKSPTQKKNPKQANATTNSFDREESYMCSKRGVPPLDEQSPKLHLKTVSTERGTSSKYSETLSTPRSAANTLNSKAKK